MQTVNITADDFGGCKVPFASIEAPYTDEGVPVADPTFVFRPELLATVLLALTMNKPLYITGATGSGKTKLAEQVASRLGWPVNSVTLSARTEAQDLLGVRTLKDGGIEFQPGALTNAMERGEILILNEISLMHPGELAALNGVLSEGEAVILADNGRTVHAHEGFRLIATDNTTGNGINGATYAGTRVLNQAFLDRWMFLHCDYPDYKTEVQILKLSCKQRPAVISSLVRLAAAIRKVNVTATGNEAAAAVAEAGMALSAPFSTRSLVTIAQTLDKATFLSLKDVVELVYSAKLNETERKFVERMVEDVFGTQAANDIAAFAA